MATQTRLFQCMYFEYEFYVRVLLFLTLCFIEIYIKAIPINCYVFNFKQYTRSFMVWIFLGLSYFLPKVKRQTATRFRVLRFSIASTAFTTESMLLIPQAITLGQTLTLRQYFSTSFLSENAEIFCDCPPDLYPSHGLPYYQWGMNTRMPRTMRRVDELRGVLYGSFLRRENCPHGASSWGLQKRVLKSLRLN